MPSKAGTLQKALRFHRAGDLCEARRLYWRILAAEPRNASALHLLGVAAHQTGRHEEAVQTIRKAIQIDPERSEFHKDLGETLAAQEQFAEAEAAFREALRLRPDFAEAHNSLGLIFHYRNQHLQAIECFARAAQLRPDFAEPFNHSGIIASARHQPEQAEACFRKAIQLDPTYAAAFNNLGILHLNRQNFDEAAGCFREALRLSPRYAAAHNHLGIVHQLRGDIEQAHVCFAEAIRLEPRSAQFHNNLGNLLRGQAHLPEALASYQKALQLNPELDEARTNLGQLLAERGESAARDQALAQAPTDALKLLSTFTFPAIPKSVEEIHQLRRTFESDLARLANEELVIDDPLRQISMAGIFYLSYQGMNDRSLLSQLASLFRRATPALNYTAPHCNAPTVPEADRRLRVGFVSRCFYNHSVGRLAAGLIRELDRPRFHVTVFTADPREDEWWQRIRTSADAVVLLPATAGGMAQLIEARQRIADAELDVLFFGDIGMDLWMYLLAFARLAPVQCTFFGHPVTTGLSTMDYFLSARDMETPDAAEHYSERLVQFENLTTYFHPIPLPAAVRSRRDFGLDEDAHLYMCMQSLFKLHPEIDAIFDGILRADPRGRIVLVAGHQDYWTKQLLARLGTALGERINRVVVLPRQPLENMLHLLRLADAVLDPIHWCSGVTALEAFAVGSPLVTLPGQFLRGRIAYACYRRMGILDCVAADADDYVRLAVRLGNDPAWRASLRGRILSANPVLFENPGIVREMEHFFVTARRQASVVASMA